MGLYRIKHTFTAGELSPRLGSRVDFERYKNGCKQLRNMTCQVQGPATRRPGFKFIYDLNRLGANATNPVVRMIPFIRSDTETYTLIFFKHTDGYARMVIATEDGLVTTTGGITPPGSSSTDIYWLNAFQAEFDIEKFDYTQSMDELIISQPNVIPSRIIHTAINNWSYGDIPFVSMPAEWPTDVNATADWPAAVTFHQQRLVFAGSEDYRQHVWMSKAGAYFTMVTGATPTEDDAFSFNMDSGTQNQVVWMASSKALAVGTLANEWTVQGSQQPAVTYKSVLTQRQTNMGSERRTPLMVGLSTLFIERHGRTINEFKYEYTTDSYETSDRSVLATHFTDYYSIVDWTFQQMPDQVVWMIRSDGSLLGCTYQREHKVIGWHLHDTDGGEFKAVTCIPGQNRTDEVWVVIVRGGTPHVFIERMEDEFTGTEASEGRFLDSHMAYQKPHADFVSDTVSNLDHLEGLEVAVLADGTVHPPQTVSSGEITLDDTSYDEVVVGLNYISEVRPYLPALPLQDGSDRGRVKRITSLHIDFCKTLGGWVGKYSVEDGEAVEELPFRNESDLMDQQIPLFSGTYSWAFLEGFDKDIEYFIRQDQPLPMTVRSITDFVEVHR